MNHPHKGHRERLRKRFLDNGLDSLADHEVLELLLFQYLPYRDTNELAHALINKFGSLANVLDAKPEQLIAVKGISQVTAVNLSLLRQIYFRCQRSYVQDKALTKLDEVLHYAYTMLTASDFERSLAVYLDAGGKVVNKRAYCSQNDTGVQMTVKSIVSEALSLSATAVMICHGHTKSVTKPSQADIDFTHQLQTTLSGVGISLIDHAIFNARGEIFSFREHGLLLV
jgi:DNA repair protein RadC